jgi:hypothetical protein
MKRVVILSLLLLVSLGVHAQAKQSPAYWVVETNINQKNFSIVRLYDKDNRLVHEVRMDGVYFDVARARHRKMLDQLLKGSYQRAEHTAARIRRESRRGRSSV